MAQLAGHIPRRRRLGLPDRWSLGAAVIAALVLLPVLSVIIFALNPKEHIWPELLSTTTPRYLKNTAILLVSVAAIAACVGTVTAWLVTMYRFPGSRLLEWALFLPLAIPAYVGAFALVDFLEYAGPVQTTLRDLFGWENSRDYWFPAVRSRTMAVIVLSASLFPYVYLLARAAFREQSAAAFDTARALGAGPIRRFFGVGLPLARPAIAAGAAVVMMETVNDYGTVDFFAVQTLTTKIFSVWLEAGNAGGAAQIATSILVLIILLVAFEKISRRRAKVFQSARGARRVEAQRLNGWRAAVATTLCTGPVLLGLILPLSVLLSHALNSTDAWLSPGLGQATINTLSVSAIAALLTLGGALIMVYGVRLSGRRLPRMLMPVTAIGYAVPGAVLGLGLLLPLAAFDHVLADTILSITGVEIGLLLTGSVAALIIAYCVRFFAIAQGATDAALGRISPSLPLAARSLGRTAGGTLRSVHMPLIRASAGSALLLIFVDCVKELPATLLLRPFNFSTLATRTYEQASLEQISEASPPALIIVITCLAATLLLAKTSR